MQGRLDGAWYVLEALDALATSAVCLGELGEVRAAQRVADRPRALAISLVRLDGAIALIVEHDRHHAGLLMHGCG